MFNFLYLILLLIAALFFGKVAEKFKLPTIVGNIFGGLMFGPMFIIILKTVNTQLSITTFQPVIADLSPEKVGVTTGFLMEFAIVMLMFSSGMETRIKDFLASFKTGIITASFGVVVPFVFGFVGTYLYLGDTIIALYVGGALSITAVALSIATLIQIDGIRTRFGMTIINAAIVDDIIGIVILSVLLSISATGHLPSAFSVGGSVVLAVLFVVIAIFIIPKIMKKMFKGLRDIRVTEGVGLSILMAGLFGVMAHLMGLHLMIGAFLGGMAIRESLTKRIQQALGRWSFGFFAPIFFAWVGFSVTFSGVAISPLVPLLVVLGLAGKVLGAGLGARISGLNWYESLLVGIGMNGRAAVDLILASVALSSGIIGRDLYSAVVFNAVIMALITPILLKVLSKRFREKGKIDWDIC
ncbi:MAG: cation:proton antiporter [Candidatus Thermoplasmatota archaeon]|nr:cation:proton antiporter [Candidatus Thermoplasmatota archaeon]